jgi:signal transduction histidine kinase/CheY-like chemotaxis protein
MTKPAEAKRPQGEPGSHPAAALQPTGFVSLRSRLVLTTFVLAFGLVVLSLVINGVLLQRVARDRALDTADVLVTLLSQSVSPGLTFESHQSVREALADVAQVPAVRFVSIVTSDGTPFEQVGVLPEPDLPMSAPTRAEMTWSNELLIAHSPVFDNEGHRIGAVHVGYSLEGMRRSVQRGALLLLLVGFVLAGIASLIARGLAIRITAPILELAVAARRVAEGRFDEPLRIHRPDEVGIVAQTFNGMASRLRASLLEVERQNRELEQKVVDRTAELRQKNLELAMQNEKVMEASRLKSAFLANMSHELRTPLNAILALSELMHDEVMGPMASEEQRKQVQMIHQSGENLLSLINEVLDLSKIEAGKMQIHYSPTKVQDVLRAAAAQVTGLARSKSIELVTTFEGEGEVWVDSDRIRQVFHNVVGNAIKFTERGEVTVHSHLDTELGLLTIRVRDTGIGIAREDHERIFQEFRQVDGSATRRFGGTGLGLAICRRLAHLMGGSITVESDVGRGSTFLFQIPVYREQPPAKEPSDLDGASWVEANLPPPEQEDPRGERQAGAARAERREVPESEARHLGHTGGCVLVVDDDELLLEALVRYMAREGLDVHVARNGKEALEEMERRRPDLMVLDLMMPGMSGFEVIEALRRQEDRPRVPVLVFTAKELTRREWMDLERSVVGVLRKGSGGVRLLLEDVRRLVGSPAKDDDIKRAA